MVLPAASVALRALKAGWHRLPPTVRRQLEDRFFYAVFQTTRVTNDAYGWRPPAPDEPPPNPPAPFGSHRGG